MRRYWFAAPGVVALLGAVGAASSGGWAVVSVAKAPYAWVAGRPLQLTWQVRQHGVTPLYGLKPTLEARYNGRRVAGLTWEFNEQGERGYRGRVTFPAPGDWAITVHSGFGRSTGVLLPVRVVDSVRAIAGTVEDHLPTIGVPAPSEYEEGRRQFAAKGCVTCHVHRAVDLTGELSTSGPDLTERRFPADYLARFLANPSIKPAANGMAMPNPYLRAKDIAPLVAFLNALTSSR